MWRCNQIIGLDRCVEVYDLREFAISFNLHAKHDWFDSHHFLCVTWGTHYVFAKPVPAMNICDKDAIASKNRVAGSQEETAAL